MSTTATVQGTEVLFFAGGCPALAISTYMPEDHRYRIALDGQIVVAMGWPGAPLTIMCSFQTREVAERVLAIVRKALPEAEIKEVGG